MNWTAAMIEPTGNPMIESLAEENCRVGQLLDGCFNCIERDGCRRSYCREEAKYAELIVLSELIFGSPNHAIQELVENRALHKHRTM